jgi:hypothetical protein
MKEMYQVVMTHAGGRTINHGGAKNAEMADGTGDRERIGCRQAYDQTSPPSRFAEASAKVAEVHHEGPKYVKWSRGAEKNRELKAG